MHSLQIVRFVLCTLLVPSHARQGREILSGYRPVEVDSHPWPQLYEIRSALSIKKNCMPPDASPGFSHTTEDIGSCQELQNANIILRSWLQRTSKSCHALTQQDIELIKELEETASAETLASDYKPAADDIERDMTLNALEKQPHKRDLTGTQMTELLTTNKHYPVKRTEQPADTINKQILALLAICKSTGQLPSRKVADLIAHSVSAALAASKIATSASDAVKTFTADQTTLVTRAQLSMATTSVHGAANVAGMATTEAASRVEHGDVKTERACWKCIFNCALCE